MDIAALLKSCLSHNNQVRKPAEAALEAARKDPRILTALLENVHGAVEVEVRHLAAVMLKKSVVKHWATTSDEVKAQVKSIVLEKILHEPAPPVRRAVADTVSVIGRFEVPDNQWPGLLDFLYQCSQSNEAVVQETALDLFGSLMDHIGQHMRAHSVVLAGMVGKALQDGKPQVRQAGLKTAQKLVRMVLTEPGSLEDSQRTQELALLAAMVPQTLQVVRACLEAGDERSAHSGFELLIEMAEGPGPLLGPHLAAVVTLMLQAAKHQEFELSTRYHAAQVLGWIARYKPKQMVKHKLVEQVLQGVLQLLREPPARVRMEAGESMHGDREEDMAMGLPAHKIGAQTLDTMALNITSKHILPGVLVFFTQGCQQASPWDRAAGMMALGTSAEGCGGLLRKKLQAVVPLLLEACQDSCQEVRGQAVFALAQTVMSTQPDILDHQDQILPCLLQKLSDPNASVQERTCFAVDALCESIGDAVVPLLDQLVQGLMGLLHCGAASMHDVALSAMASVIDAADVHFRPFLPQLLPVLKQMLMQQRGDLLPVRTRATECLALLIQSQGPEAFGPELQVVTDLVLQGFELDCTELREYGHGFFSTLASTMKTELAALLPRLVDVAFTSCDVLDYAIMDENGRERPPGAAVEAGEEEEGLEVGASLGLSVRTGVVDEKAAALQALGMYAHHCSKAFQPHFERSIPLIKKMTNHIHEDIRSQAYDAAGHIITAARSAFPGPPGMLSPQAELTMQELMPCLVASVMEDEDKESVASALLAGSKALKLLGSSASAFLEPWAAAAAALLQGEALCQHRDSDEEEEVGTGPAGGEEEDDEGEADIQLVEMVGELLPALSAVAGAAAYAPVFAARHWPPLLQALQPSRPPGLRTAAVGALADTSIALGLNIAPFLPQAMPVLLREMRAEDAGNRRNAAFCAGALVQAAPEAGAAHAMAILQGLHPLLAPQEAPEVCDNALSAVARMMLAVPQQLPMLQVLTALLAHLPLKEDLQEVEAVYGALCSVLPSASAVPAAELAPVLPQLVAALGAVVLQDGVADTVKQGVASALQAAVAAQPQALAPLLSALPAEQQTALNAFSAA